MARILIIEDEQSMRGRLVALVNQIDGIEVDCAANEQEADQRIKSRQYDVALVDLQLSSKATSKLAGLRYASHLSILGCQTIIVTGDTQDFIPEVGMVLTGSDVVTKPFKDAVLLGNVERALIWADRNASASAKPALPPDLDLRPLERCCYWKSTKIHLTPTQLSIVNALWTANGDRISAIKLKEQLKSGGTHAVTQHIASIRSKFKEVDPEFDKIINSGGSYFWTR